MNFKKLGPFAALMIVTAGFGILYPPLVSMVIALAAVFVSGVAVVTGDYIVRELRRAPSQE